MEKTTHQFGLFGYQRPKLKIPIDAEKIRRAKALYNNGDVKASAALIREVRESLMEFEKRLNSAKDKDTKQTQSRHRNRHKLKGGDNVIVEIEGHGKSEFVDATVLSVTHRGVNVKTYWGREIRDHPPARVRRR